MKKKPMPKTVADIVEQFQEEQQKSATKGLIDSSPNRYYVYPEETTDLPVNPYSQA